MKLYYQEKGIEIWHGDCRDWGGTADVLITDPPYGVGLKQKTPWHTRGTTGRAAAASVVYEDGAAEVRDLIEIFFPWILERVPRALVFSGTAAMFSYPEPASVGAVFNLAGTGHCSWGFQCIHPILYYGKDPFLADGKGSRANSFQQRQARSDDVDHPCPKPIQWMHWAVNRASRPGETVLDPFMGSGTTLRAAKDLCRRAIGIEIEERYCEIAAQRLEQEVLFSPEPEPEHQQLAL